MFRLACYTNNHLVNSGQPVHVSAETSVDPDRYYFTYDWTTTGGAIVGHGNVITINTDDLKPDLIPWLVMQPSTQVPRNS